MALNLFTTATRLKTCIDTALKADRDDGTSWGGETCVYPGAFVPFDSCCDGGGQAWVVAPSGGPTTTFPALDINGLTNCRNQTQVVTYEVGVIRCVCTDDCTCTKKEADAQSIFSDLRALLTGIFCCFSDENQEWRLQGWSLIGPEGGCGGSRVLLVVEEPLPCCPEETP